jgi:hypothetical protein
MDTFNLTFRRLELLFMDKTGTYVEAPDDPRHGNFGADYELSIVKLHPSLILVTEWKTGIYESGTDYGHGTICVDNDFTPMSLVRVFLDDYFFFASQIGDFPREQLAKKMKLAELKHKRYIQEPFPTMGLITSVET